MADLEKQIDEALTTHKRLAVSGDNEESYWMTGGCLEYAKALKETLRSGAKMFDVVEPEIKAQNLMYPGFPHHVVVRHGGKYHDYEGSYTEQELLDKWRARAPRKIAFRLEPHSAARARDHRLSLNRQRYVLALSVARRHPWAKALDTTEPRR
jgi:hypothetical protein